MRCLSILAVALIRTEVRAVVQNCQQGQICANVGSKCCGNDASDSTYYCIGNSQLGMSWQLAPGEKCTLCEKACFAAYDPKCGTDGITYQNQCYLENAQCTFANLELSHDGECIGPGGCPLGCAPGYQISYDGTGVSGAYPVPACSSAAAFCVPVTPNCMKSCPEGYYLITNYDTTAVQYSSCGETIWCKPSPLLPSQCAGVLCQNNGYMTYTTSSCMCNCMDGYYGDDCGQQYVSNCQGLNCANSAQLVAGATGCSCACSSGYVGQYCQDIVSNNNCGGMVCHNGGVLSQGSAGCTCECLNGYFGQQCEQNPNCPNLNCQNGGFVSEVNNNCECACPFGFYGDQCELQNFGEWISIKSQFFNFCLDTDITGNIIIQDCMPGKDTQTFLVKNNYLLTTDERCMTIMGPQRTGNVALQPCTYLTNQYWIVQEPAILTFDKLCMDIDGGIFAGGRDVIVWDCHGTENQAWSLIPAFPPVSSTGGCPEFLCQVDPCQVYQCPLYPMAQCTSDYCQCTAHFQIYGSEVSCNPTEYPDVTPATTVTVSG